MAALSPTSAQLWVVLARCHKALSTLVEESVGSAGLCMSDFMILEALLHKAPLSITEIQGKALLAKGSMTVAVDRLENKGLIVRKLTKEDRRARPLELTSKGRTLIEGVLKVHLQELNTWMADLSKSEIRAAYVVLKKLGLHAAEIRENEKSPKRKVVSHDYDSKK